MHLPTSSASEREFGMHEPITLLHREASTRDSRPGSLSSLPLDLLDQIRSRVRLLALFLMIGFAIDPVLYFVDFLIARLIKAPLPETFHKMLGFQLTNLGAMAASTMVWALTRRRKMSPATLLTLGLIYEVLICFVIAYGTIWEHFVVKGILPYMTWVWVVVILFPVILPGPPRRMLVAAILSSLMVPLSLALLHIEKKIHATPDVYVDAVVQGAFSIALAYMGARVVFGLGREIARARELGSYRLEEKLGQGGMGEVWRARHRMLARPAAIKLIRQLGPNTSVDARQRFEREAQVIASLRSPHTVDLFDFGVAQDGTFYYAMELLEGMDADKLVRQFGPIAPERVIYLWRQICHSLAEAESYGLVHRDIKPANIYLCRYGIEHDFVKVLDFGLVKSLDGSSPGGDEREPLTRENVIHGTPAFMAPEQAFGGASLDIRTDIYATGCVSYWLLTGQLLFTADSPMGLLLHHAKTPPSPPSQRSEVPIPTALDELVLACLAKDPADRPQSAQELLHRLNEIRGVPPWNEDRAREWWQQHKPSGENH